jgi:hypothetical protein
MPHKWSLNPQNNKLTGTAALPYLLVHVLLENKIKIGKISSLPASMSMIRTALDRRLYPA